MLGKAIHESLYFLWKSFSVVHLVAIFIGFVIVTYFMLRFWKADVVTCYTSHGPSDTKERVAFGVLVILYLKMFLW